MSSSKNAIVNEHVFTDVAVVFPKLSHIDLSSWYSIYYTMILNHVKEPCVHNHVLSFEIRPSDLNVSNMLRLSDEGRGDISFIA